MRLFFGILLLLFALFQSGLAQGFINLNFENGTNYSNTPVGAVTYTDEPDLPGVNSPSIYFGLWESGKSFAICSWASRNTPRFQAAGDPFIIK